MLHLLKSLLILDVFDFKSEIVEQKLDDDTCIVLLIFKGCPWVVSMNGKWALGVSSRSLLLICGWILAENNIFERHRVLFLE